MVVNEFLAGKGFAVGETLDRPGAGQVDPIIVGVAESTTTRDFPIAAGPLGAFGLESEQRSARGSSTAGRSRGRRSASSTSIGATVASRAVITDPPPESEWAPEVQDFGGTDEATVAILVLIVVMALHRGRAARRPGVRGRRAQAAAQPRPDVGHGWHPRAVAARHHRWRLRARQRRRAHRRGGSVSVSPGSWCPSCSRGPGPTSARSTCRGCTWPASRASVCSARSWPRWCRRTSPPARTSSRSSPAAAATARPP